MSASNEPRASPVISPYIVLVVVLKLVLEIESRARRRFQKREQILVSFCVPFPTSWFFGEVARMDDNMSF